MSNLYEVWDVERRPVLSLKGEDKNGSPCHGKEQSCGAYELSLIETLCLSLLKGVKALSLSSHRLKTTTTLKTITGLSP